MRSSARDDQEIGSQGVNEPADGLNRPENAVDARVCANGNGFGHGPDLPSQIRRNLTQRLAEAHGLPFVVRTDRLSKKDCAGGEGLKTMRTREESTFCETRR